MVCLFFPYMVSQYPDILTSPQTYYLSVFFLASLLVGSMTATTKEMPASNIEQSWRQHPIKKKLYGYQPPITETDL